MIQLQERLSKMEILIEEFGEVQCLIERAANDVAAEMLDREVTRSRSTNCFKSNNWLLHKASNISLPRFDGNICRLIEIS